MVFQRDTNFPQKINKKLGKKWGIKLTIIDRFKNEKKTQLNLIQHKIHELRSTKNNKDFDTTYAPILQKKPTN